MSNCKRIFIVTTLVDDWGGSESLWFASVPFLLQAGFKIHVLKEKIDRNHPTFNWLRNQGVVLTELINKNQDKKNTYLIEDQNYFENKITSFLFQLEAYKPDLVLINQGINFDGLYYGLYSRRKGIPYSIISHKTVEFFWPKYNERDYMKGTWQKSLCNFFVSEHNLQYTQLQFGMDIPNTYRVYYPVKKFSSPLPYPNSEPLYRLACIGRLFVLDKGQDIILRILAEEKWKNRPIQVDFYGTGVDESGLKELACYLGLTNVRFCGFSIEEDIWSNYHGLLLASRSEGFPLVVQEAMSSARIVIVGNAGGTGELVRDGINGFLGEANLKDFSRNMENAWENRDQWETMGQKAFNDFNSFYPSDSMEIFFEKIKSLVNG